jgi:GNAT superfamily N-acetyltransferase
MGNLSYINYHLLKKGKRKIWDLYIRAFPIEERCPFPVIRKKAEQGKGEFFGIFEKNIFVGLIYNIVYKDIVYIYYLAITDELRNKGYGTKVLTDVKNIYKNKRIILMAETLDQNASNYQERINRNKFYSKNGFEYQGYTIMEWGVVYDMLGLKPTTSKKEEFKDVIKYYFGEFFYNNIYVNHSDIER